jgi:hypothetical protein
MTQNWKWLLSSTLLLGLTWNSAHACECQGAAASSCSPKTSLFKKRFTRAQNCLKSATVAAQAKCGPTQACCQGTGCPAACCSPGVGKVVFLSCPLAIKLLYVPFELVAAPFANHAPAVATCPIVPVTAYVGCSSDQACVYSAGPVCVATTIQPASHSVPSAPVCAGGYCVPGQPAQSFAPATAPAFPGSCPVTPPVTFRVVPPSPVCAPVPPPPMATSPVARGDLPYSAPPQIARAPVADRRNALPPGLTTPPQPPMPPPFFAGNLQVGLNENQSELQIRVPQAPAITCESFKMNVGNGVQLSLAVVDKRIRVSTPHLKVCGERVSFTQGTTVVVEGNVQMQYHSKGAQTMNLQAERISLRLHRDQIVHMAIDGVADRAPIVPVSGTADSDGMDAFGIWWDY